MKKIIYDLGANNGDNIPYYFLKSDLVIAVEANPDLCNIMKKRFKKEILQKKLFIENCIVTSKKSSSLKEKFYLHKTNHLLSQYPKPKDNKLDFFIKTSIVSKNILSLIKKYGYPHYIKIDLEEYDYEILKLLLKNNIMPDYLSVETNMIDTFCALVTLGEYKSFKIVKGHNVHDLYKNVEINHNVKKKYSFPKYSAGPFGNDIKGLWITKKNFFYFLSKNTLEWIDIHCSKVDVADENYMKLPKKNFFQRIKSSLTKRIKLLF
jgi:FkbM family methyltransferase